MNTQNENISLIARNYAQALCCVVKDGKADYDSISNELNLIVETFLGSKDLQFSMENTAIDINTKYDIINSIFGGKISQEMINFLKILIEKRHLQLLPQINKAFTDIIYDVKNIQSATIISAIELTDSKKQEIINVLAKKLNKTIIPEWSINDEIIAGLKIKLDDNILDLSLKNKIEKLSKDLLLK